MTALYVPFDLSLLPHACFRERFSTGEPPRLCVVSNPPPLHTRRRARRTLLWIRQLKYYVVEATNLETTQVLVSYDILRETVNV